MQRKHTTKRAAPQSPPNPPGASKPRAGTKTHKPKTDAPQIETYYPPTSRHPHSNQNTRAAVEIRVKRFLSGKTLKAWRKEHGYSAHALGVELGVSRAYIKQIEGGSKPASQKLIERFHALRETLGERSAPQPETETARVVSKYKLPASFEILAKPKRCATCRAYFVGRTPQQKFCGERCARLGRKAQRTKPARKLSVRTPTKNAGGRKQERGYKRPPKRGTA